MYVFQQQTVRLASKYENYDFRFLHFLISAVEFQPSGDLRTVDAISMPSVMASPSKTLFFNSRNRRLIIVHFRRNKSDPENLFNIDPFVQAVGIIIYHWSVILSIYRRHHITLILYVTEYSIKNV